MSLWKSRYLRAAFPSVAASIQHGLVLSVHSAKAPAAAAAAQTGSGRSCSPRAGQIRVVTSGSLADGIAFTAFSKPGGTMYNYLV